jgi:hypothetical protein
VAGQVIAVDAELVVQHASRLGAVREGVAEAASAVGSVDLGGGAFGVLCSFLVPPAQLVAGIAQSMIVSADDMLDRTVDELRGFASDVEDRETTIVEQVRALQRGIG